MLNLTLTPDADTASVLAQVSTNSTGVTLVRADQNGTVPVRLQEGQAVESGVLTVRDYEAALVGPVTYIATTTAIAEVRRNAVRYPRAVAGQWVSSSTSAIPNPTIVTEEGEPFARFTRSTTAAVALRAGGYSSSGAALPAGRVHVVLEVRGTGTGAPYVSLRQGTSGTNLVRSAGLTLTSTWQQVVVPYDVPTAGTGYNVILVANTSPVGETFEVRRAGIIIDGDSYFDGSSAGAEWTGSVNASASIVRDIQTVEVSTDLAGVTSDMVSVVAQPQFNASARVTVGQAFARPTKSVRHDIIGRPDPVFTLRRGGFRTGTIRAVVTDLDAYEMFDAIQQQAAVVLFRFAAHERGGRAAVDFYAVVEDLSSDTTDGVRALDLTLRVAEVRRPAGFLLGALGWTYGALAGLGLTYAAVPANFTTYADLAIEDAS